MNRSTSPKLVAPDIRESSTQFDFVMMARNGERPRHPVDRDRCPESTMVSGMDYEWMASSECLRRGKEERSERSPAGKAEERKWSTRTHWR
jgi:hypothetical protein